MIIIGIDPGTATTGYSILKKEGSKMGLLDYGCILTKPDFSDQERLNIIAKDIDTLAKKWKPEYASIEKIYFQKNVKTAITVAQARGVIIQKLTENKVNITEYTPLEIKNSVCGYGKADKKMVQTMVKKILKLKKTPTPDDAADAIAGAICLANSIAIIKKQTQ